MNKEKSSIGQKILDIGTKVLGVLAFVLTIGTCVMYHYKYNEFMDSTTLVAEKVTVINKYDDSQWKNERLVLVVQNDKYEFNLMATYSEYHDIEVGDVLDVNIYYFNDTQEPYNNQKLKLNE